MEKLPEDFKKKWTAALRSGEYKQGKDMLYDKETDSFCCLGVACVISGIDKSKLNGLTMVGNSEPEYELSPFDELPELLIHRTINDVAANLAQMNDSEVCFEEIADWIDKNL